MSFRRCPGASAFAQPKIELIACSHCGKDVEIWSDEADAKCLACGKTVIRTTSQSCVDWCRYAKECLGDEKYRKYRDMKLSMRKEALLKAVEDQFQFDEGRRERARAVVTVASQILRGEPASDPNVVVAAAALSQAQGDGKGDADASRRVLENLNYPEGFIKEVVSILGNPAPDASSSLNARVVHDAVLLSRSHSAASDAFLTPAGRKLAEEEAMAKRGARKES